MYSTRNLKFTIAGLILLLGMSLFYNPFCKTDASAVADTSADGSNDVSISKIDIGLIQSMVGNYKSNQLKFVESGLNKRDAQSIWFDLGTLKNFVRQIEQNTKKHDSKINSDRLGVRMYYASYPAQEDMFTYKDLKSTPKEYEKMHTLIMIPTLKIKNINVDYNPIDPATYDNGIKILSSKGKSSQIVAKMMSTATAAQNHGTLSPPENDELF
ncbi:hypothetical protein [Flavobacterium sp.]|uniref:hypothetical protein n=1 Tax=Flavobacterium sp. TaxID=239 RepID=UPI00261BBBD3|nr:hypothetical protein [Flavobacterium sp.]MDG2433063.1 hypothetical protein [Flavobacterium sp.]